MPLRLLPTTFALMLAASFPAAAQQPASQQYPAALKISLNYSRTTEEDIGAVNVPQCRSGGWKASLKLNLVRKSANAGLVVYGVRDGSWTAGGDCTGHLEFEMGDRMCSWTMKGSYGGSGSFPSEASAAELTVYPGAGFFVFAFRLDAPGGYTYSWDPYCERAGNRGTVDWGFDGVVTGTVAASGGGPRFVARADTAWENENIGGRYRSHAVASVYERLKAVPGGPYAIERGQVVQLDGSGSEGAIDKYEWALQPGGECPAGTKKDLKLEGEKVSFKALCPLTATLTVSEGGDRDSKPASVAVRPRAWRTPFEEAAEGRLEASAPFMRIHVDSVTGERFWGILDLVGGENVSAEDPAAPADQPLSPFSANSSWDQSGYVLEQVDDDGPFDGLWFVSEYKVRLKRQVLVNKYLLPGGPTIRGESVHAENKRQGTAIDGYLAAIRSHEGVRNPAGTLGHSGLMEKALRADDPARKLEALAETDPAELRRRADEAIHGANVRICNQSRDPLPIIWRGQVALPKDDGTGWMMGPATVGGDAPQYGDMKGCG